MQSWAYSSAVFLRAEVVVFFLKIPPPTESSLSPLPASFPSCPLARPGPPPRRGGSPPRLSRDRLVGPAGATPRASARGRTPRYTGPPSGVGRVALPSSDQGERTMKMYVAGQWITKPQQIERSEEHTSELQSQSN